MNDQIRVEAGLCCDECGRYGAVDLGGRKLCPDCYDSHGSCCPKFGQEQTEQGN